MNFYKLLFVIFVIIQCVNGTKKENKIYLFGEAHIDKKAQKLREDSWKKYENGEIEFLSEGSPLLELTPPEILRIQDQFSIDNRILVKMHGDLLELEILLCIAVYEQDETLYQHHKEGLKFIQERLRHKDEKNLIHLPDDYESGKKEAKKLFNEHWKNFTAQNCSILREWINYKVLIFEIGAEVELYGLKSESFNGLCGIVTGGLNGRMKVKLENNKGEKSFAPVNLKLKTIEFDLTKDWEKNEKILNQFKDFVDIEFDLTKGWETNWDILNQFKDFVFNLRNFHMAQVIANKYENSEKDIYVHLGDSHRIPVETILRDEYNIHYTRINSIETEFKLF